MLLGCCHCPQTGISIPQSAFSGSVPFPSSIPSDISNDSVPPAVCGRCLLVPTNYSISIAISESDCACGGSYNGEFSLAYAGLQSEIISLGGTACTWESYARALNFYNPGDDTTACEDIDDAPRFVVQTFSFGFIQLFTLTANWRVTDPVVGFGVGRWLRWGAAFAMSPGQLTECTSARYLDRISTAPSDGFPGNNFATLCSDLVGAIPDQVLLWAA